MVRSLLSSGSYCIALGLGFIMKGARDLVLTSSFAEQQLQFHIPVVKPDRFKTGDS